MIAAAPGKAKMKHRWHVVHHHVGKPVQFAAMASPQTVTLGPDALLRRPEIADVARPGRELENGRWREC